ncbi:hypothetical protein Tdes44962_MAKER08578 [Teratosphaeria destructans]|uniref:Uncharacterized protein n=1 Tax=Teratosphaeria destructans TaxID=418781 RepID=A0A9W7SVU1_9PEZI|nr:hypothetical protein Tdes44962_MAKER08578 [Teratosphaeria destructans]
MSSSSSSSSTNDQTPSLIGGHAQYVKGAAEVCLSPPPEHPPSDMELTTTGHQSAIGAVAGETWTQSGEQDKRAGIDAMKQAAATRDPGQTGFGRVEEVAGKAAGCEGMEREGAQSKTTE